MKQMWQQGKILNIKETENGTIIQVVTTLSKEEILKYQTPKGLFADVKLQDERLINHEQRKKFYALINDISDYTGHTREELKDYFKFMYCSESNIEIFSLSDCTLEVARELITYTLTFAMDNDIPLLELPLERTDDISKYLVYTLKSQKCCICSEKGINYTIDKEKNKMCLCENHREIAKDKGLEEFCKMWKVYGINYVG